MTRVGIIANPASGRDIRRLVALGTVVGIQDKVNMVRRILTGLAGAGVDEVHIMPDGYQIGGQARAKLDRSAGRLKGHVHVLEMPVQHGPEDSTRAAAMLAEMGAACIITLGGDGTNRVVAKGCGDVPLVPVSTGTNNVVPYLVEGTLAGLAAGFVASNREAVEDCGFRSKRLEVALDGGGSDSALVDVALVAERFAGARAVWDATLLGQVVVARGMPDTIGMSSLAGYLSPVNPREDRGLQVVLNEAAERRITFPIAPGVLATVGVESVRELRMGDSVDIEGGACILALDGEREIPLPPRSRASIALRADGPWIVDVHQALRYAAERAFLVRGD